MRLRITTGQLSKLETLNVAYNKITVLPESVIKLRKLLTFGLAGHPVTFLNFNLLEMQYICGFFMILLGSLGLYIFRFISVVVLFDVLGC